MVLKSSCVCKLSCVRINGLGGARGVLGTSLVVVCGEWFVFGKPVGVAGCLFGFVSCMGIGVVVRAMIKKLSLRLPDLQIRRIVLNDKC